jgi:hypothetical protein
MRVEAWIFGALSIFFAVVTPIYYFLSREPTGTAALIMTFLLVLMITLYFGLVARRIDRARGPEVRRYQVAGRRFFTPRVSGRCSAPHPGADRLGRDVVAGDDHRLRPRLLWTV